MGKCPPGVVCIENMTLLLIVILVVVVIMAVYMACIGGISKHETKAKCTVNMGDYPDRINQGLYPRPGFAFSNIENDVLLNPYQGPLRDNRLFPGLNIFSSRMPINIPTQSFDTSYRQIGILTRLGHKETILPLLGRPLITNRDKWNFYTMSESNNLLKLPISYNGRKCMTDTGCNDLYTGDVVRVDGYNDDFKVTTYETDMPKYIPFI
jgi:hypothetical protein